VAAECEVSVDAALESSKPLLLESRDLGVREGPVREVRERRAVPEGEPRTKPVGGMRGIARGEGASSLLGKALEAEEVDCVPINTCFVAAGSRHEHAGGEHPAKTGNERRERVRGCLRWAVLPQVVDQLLPRNDRVCLQ
jgi:hypothetical protein